MRALVALFLVNLIGLATATNAAGAAVFMTLDSPTERAIAATAISEDGSTVVGQAFSTSSPHSPNEAFRWTAETGTVGLGDLPAFNPTGSAGGVSGDGSVVVGQSANDLNSNSTSSSAATVWTAAAGLMPLPGMDPLSYTLSVGISQDGSVIASQDLDQQMGFVWTAAQGSVPLGGLAVWSADPPRSDARAISAAGDLVVGCSNISPTISEAFRWTQGTMTGLGQLSTTNANASSCAEGTNTDGSIVVGEGNTDPTVWGTGPHAFRWTQETGLVDLSTWPGSTFSASSDAHSVSSDGSVILGSMDTIPMIWRADIGMQPLKDVVSGEYGMELPGWTLWSAVISADGRRIVGGAYDPTGASRAYLLVLGPPFPLQIQITRNGTFPITVTIFGSDTVDVTTIDPTALRLGPNQASLDSDLTNPAVIEDVNGDGKPDLLVTFREQDAGISLTDSQTCLTGNLSRQVFQACDAIGRSGCGLGFELVPILPALLWLRGRRRRKLA